MRQWEAGQQGVSLGEEAHKHNIKHTALHERSATNKTQTYAAFTLSDLGNNAPTDTTVPQRLYAAEPSTCPCSPVQVRTWFGLLG